MTGERRDLTLFRQSHDELFSARVFSLHVLVSQQDAGQSRKIASWSSFRVPTLCFSQPFTRSILSLPNESDSLQFVCQFTHLGDRF
jgi:hypothetical protein